MEGKEVSDAELRGLIHRLRHGPMGQSDAELAADVIEAQLAQRKGGSDARR